MEVTGLVFSVYKDVYFLAKSIYRLATSAQHYKTEQEGLLTQFHSQFLYLRTFHYLFFIVCKKKLSVDDQLNKVRVDPILQVRPLGMYWNR